MTLSVHDIEHRIATLPLDEQLWLLEQLAHHIRIKSELTAMAQDPQVQTELTQIQQEFTLTELDGLCEP